MRIALVCNRFHPSLGGVQQHVLRVAEWLAAEHQVTVLTNQLTPDEALLDDYKGVRIVRFEPMVRYEHFKLPAGLGRYLSSHSTEFDLVHVHGWHDSLAMIVAQAWRGPYVFTLHSHAATATRFRGVVHHLYRPVGLHAVRRASRVVCVSDHERIRWALRVPEAANWEVISNGVDRTGLQAAAAKIEAIPGHLVSVGRVEQYKRIDLTIRALVSLPNARLTIVGSGPAEPELKAIAQDNGVHDRVWFAGALLEEHLQHLLASASVLISMSELEAQGLACLEAMAIGIPVVASDIPAHRDLATMAPEAICLVNLNSAAADLPVAITEALQRQRRPIAAVPDWADVAASLATLYQHVLDDRAQLPHRVG